MIWTAWKNSKQPRTGVGYGFKIKPKDRDQHFDRIWSTVILELPTATGFDEVEVNIAKASFWGDCREVISAAIGRWLMSQGAAPWPRRMPPKYYVQPRDERRFRITGRAN